MSQQGSDQNNPENSAERPPVRPISLRPSESSGSLGGNSGALPAPLKLQPLGRPGGGPPPAPPSPMVRPGSQPPGGNLGSPPPAPPPGPPNSGYLGQGRPPGPPAASAPGLMPQTNPAAPPQAAPSSGLPAASATPSRIEFQQLELKGAKAAAAAAAAAGGPPGVNIPPRPVNHKSAERPPEDPSGVVSRDWPPRKVDLNDGPTGTVPVDQAPAPRFLPGPEASANRSLTSSKLTAPDASRVPLGPPPDLDDSPARGGMETDSKASWGENNGGANTATGGRPLPRPKPQRAPMGKGPVILVTAFAAVLLAVLAWPPKKNPTPVAALTSSTTPEPPVSVATPSQTPQESASPSATASATPEPDQSPLAANLPSETPEPIVETPEPVETPRPTPKPVVVETPRPTPKPVASATPKPSPKPVAVVTPAETPRPVAVVTPKPIIEEPPAKSDQPICSVRVAVIPADVDAKVYLVNEADRYSDHSSGSVRLQQVKKGTYTLKIIANGYETFTKKIDVSKDHKLSVRLERIPPPQPAYQAPAPGPSYDPAPYNPPAPAPYYAPPPSGGSYQIQAPGI